MNDRGSQHVSLIAAEGRFASWNYRYERFSKKDSFISKKVLRFAPLPLRPPHLADLGAPPTLAPHRPCAGIALGVRTQAPFTTQDDAEVLQLAEFKPLCGAQRLLCGTQEPLGGVGKKSVVAYIRALLWHIRAYTVSESLCERSREHAESILASWNPASSANSEPTAKSPRQPNRLPGAKPAVQARFKLVARSQPAPLLRGYSENSGVDR